MSASVAQVIQRLADGPELGHRHQIARHQAPGAVFGEGQSFLDQGTGFGRQVLQDLALLIGFEILDQVDRIVAFQLGDSCGQFLRLKLVQHHVA